MRGVIIKVTKVGRGEGRRSLHSRPQSCCPAPGALSGAPPPDNAALRSAAGLILETDKDRERTGRKVRNKRNKKYKKDTRNGEKNDTF